MSSAELSVSFSLQMCLILIICQLAGWGGRRYFGQPRVIGEMIAGVLLGPSLFGLLLPQWQHILFPAESLNMLYIGAQLGVGLFMFLVGIDFRSELFRHHAGTAAAVSLAGMLVPFALAPFLAYGLVGNPGLFSSQITYVQAVLFLGAAISITGFPVLARIIYDQGLGGTALGTLALSAGAIGDIAAWCVLAVVLATFGAGPATALKAILGGAAYATFMLTAGRALLNRLGGIAERNGGLSHTLLGVVLAILMLCVAAADAIGIHAVFGGFLLGLAMPRGVLTRELQQKLEPIVVVFLLPMFFTYSGLSTRMELIVGGPFLPAALLILVASILGKGVACWAAARMCGTDNRMALAIGSLMNTRGLMELILANIGLQKGVIQAPLFSILVLMAIVTTLTAAPLCTWFYGRHPREHPSGVLGQGM